MPAAALDGEQRARLAQLAEALIPGGSGMPSAAAADTTGDALDRVLATRADLLPSLRRAVALSGPASEATVALHDSDRQTFEALVLVLSCAYVQSDAVRASLGYPGQVPVEIPAQEERLDELLAPVRARGPRFLSASAEGPE